MSKRLHRQPHQVGPEVHQEQDRLHHRPQVQDRYHVLRNFPTLQGLLLHVLLSHQLEAELSLALHKHLSLQFRSLSLSSLPSRV